MLGNHFDFKIDPGQERFGPRRSHSTVARPGPGQGGLHHPAARRPVREDKTFEHFIQQLQLNELATPILSTDEERVLQLINRVSTQILNMLENFKLNTDFFVAMSNTKIR